MKLSKWTAGLGLALGAFLGAAEAEAFCGFYVSGADAKLFNNATMVVLMRDGIRTVLSMQNDYEGPPSSFAMVVPVPVVLQEENVKTLPREIFAKIDQLAAPRLVEYWEQDPCAQRQRYDEVAEAAAPSPAKARSEAPGAAADYGVTVEAEFSVGEYEIVILGAKDSSGLDRWLRDNQYKIPDGAEPVLRPYVASNMKFFVAKVNTDKVQFETVDGRRRAKLSPLRFHYDDDRFSLPVRLGLLNSGGTQDLIVHILSPNKRFEVANYPNVTIPTNLDLDEKAIDQFGGFYADLFDRTLEKHPKAVVTEYAWDAATCDPCPTPPLQHGELMTLGADVIAGDDTSRPRIPIVVEEGGGDAPAFDAAPSMAPGRRRVPYRGIMGPVRSCYGELLSEDRTAEGKMELSYQVNAQSQPTNLSVRTSGKLPAKLVECVKTRAPSMRVNEPPGQPVKLSLALRSIAQPPSMNFVLTRLHARYSKEGLGEDLVFREAPPIMGGREVYGEGKKLERSAKVEPNARNNFQGRYAIRHLWEGPIECKEPVRGVWGGPPAGKQRQTKSALDLAFAPRGKTELASLVVQDVPEIGITGVGPGRADPEAYFKAKRKAKRALEESATVPPSADVPPEGGGCGCVVAPGADDAGTRGGVALGFAALAAVMGLFGRRRRP